MWRVLYSITLYLLTPVFLLHLFYRGIRNPEYRRDIKHRFGFVHKGVPGVKTICIHAVSVGEVRAIAPVIKKLLLNYPDHNILVTTTTPTGKDQVLEMYGEDIQHAYLPWDLVDTMRRFVQRVQPSIFVVVETELWPNLFFTLCKNKIPLLVVNARLSEKSARGYSRFKSFSLQMLNQVDQMLVQTDKHAERFTGLRMDPDRIKVTGNLKFDLIIPDTAEPDGKNLKLKLGNRPVWVAASTHQGEDEIILAAYAIAKNLVTDLVLILVPRHPERFQQVYDLASKEFLTVNFSDRSSINQNVEIIIGDVMGRLMSLYYCADIAFIGGSLVPRGGQNPIEATAAGIPLIMGGSRYNFEQVCADLIEAGAMYTTNTSEDMAQSVCKILTDSALKESMGQASSRTFNANKGAVDHCMKTIDEYLSGFLQ